MSSPKAKSIHGSGKSSIKLSEWASQNGLTYREAYRLFRQGKLPTLQDKETGTIRVQLASSEPVVLYSCGADSDRTEVNMGKLEARALELGFHHRIPVAETCAKSRPQWLRILAQPTITIIIADGPSLPLGYQQLIPALEASGRKLITLEFK